MAAQILETISKDDRERMIYEDQLLYEADKLAEKRYAVRVGKEEERIKTTMEIARNMKMLDIPFDKIFKSTGISMDVLQTL